MLQMFGDIDPFLHQSNQINAGDQELDFQRTRVVSWTGQNNKIHEFSPGVETVEWNTKPCHNLKTAAI